MKRIAVINPIDERTGAPRFPEGHPELEHYKEVTGLTPASFKPKWLGRKS